LRSLGVTRAHYSSYDTDHLPTEQFYQTGTVFKQSSPGAVNPASPLYQEDFQFDPDPVNWNPPQMYNADHVSWPSTLVVPQQNQGTYSQERPISLIGPNPWNSENAQFSEHQQNATPGVVAFEPTPIAPIAPYASVARQNMSEITHSVTTFGPEPVSPACDSDSDGWVIPSYPSSYAASHGSPHSQGSPPANPPSPPRHDIRRSHNHIFAGVKSRTPKPKLPRGRQRSLTAIEKKQARDVREAKACWACHISKTKV
jgi:hypothetical protein